MELIKVSSDMPQMEVLKQDTVSISTVNAGTGSRENGITVFEEAVISILEYYAVDWSVKQIREVAELFFSDCYWFSLSELKHFVVKVKKADFEPLKDYSKIAPKHIMQCATIYAQEALNARGRYNFLQKSTEDSPNEQETGQYVDFSLIKDAMIKFGEEWDKNFGSKTNEVDEAELKRSEQERKDWIESQGDKLNWAEFQKQFGKKS